MKLNTLCFLTVMANLTLTACASGGVGMSTNNDKNINISGYWVTCNKPQNSTMKSTKEYHHFEQMGNASKQSAKVKIIQTYESTYNNSNCSGTPIQYSSKGERIVDLAEYNRITQLTNNKINLLSDGENMTLTRVSEVEFNRNKF